MITFENAFKCIIDIEGGYVNDSKDPGGETKYGISKRAYPDIDIRNLSLDMARSIYKRDYWDACRCDTLPFPLNIYVFDSAINQGCKSAIKILQEMLGVSVDGIIGNKTIQAAQKAKSEDAALYMALRAIRYTQTTNFSLYGKGWFKRLFIIAAHQF